MKAESRLANLERAKTINRRSSNMKHRIVGSVERGFAVLEPSGAILYDLLESRELAIRICRLLNSGVGPEWGCHRKRIMISFAKTTGAVQQAIDALYSRYERNPCNARQGVIWFGEYAGLFELSPFNGRIRINMLSATITGMGIGRKVLEAILNEADAHQCEVELTAQAFGCKALTSRQLMNWYKRHGFERVPGSASMMIRMPKGGTNGREVVQP